MTLLSEHFRQLITIFDGLRDNGLQHYIRCGIAVAVLFSGRLAARRLGLVAGDENTQLLGQRKSFDISTNSFSQSNRVYPALARWKVHMVAMKRFLTDKNAVDPTTGKGRTYWSYKVDAFEREAEITALAPIGRNFDIADWDRQLNALLDKVSPGGNLREAVGRLGLSGIKSPSSSGNAVRLPVDGNQGYEWRRRLIKGARKRVLFGTAYLSVDQDAKLLIEDLAECRKRGVDVAVMLDNMGADSFVFGGPDPRYAGTGEGFEYGDLVKILIDAGVVVTFWREEGFTHKNHAKCIVVDSEVALVTDRNVGSCYFRNPGYSSMEAVYTGPCVADIESMWSELWRMGGGGALPGQAVYSSMPRSALFDSLRDSPQDDELRLAENAWASVLASTPVTMKTGMDPILLTLLLAIRAAESTVDLEFAYLVLCRAIRDELIAALKRGVRVRIVTNSRSANDLWWICASSLVSLLPVVQAGGQLIMAHTFETCSGHVHAKVAVVDDRYLLLGSWNLWLRSHLYEAELNVLLDNPKLAKATSASIDALQESPAYVLWDEAMVRAGIEEDPDGVDWVRAKFV